MISNRDRGVNLRNLLKASFLNNDRANVSPSNPESLVCGEQADATGSADSNPRAAARPNFRAASLPLTSACGGIASGVDECCESFAAFAAGRFFYPTGDIDAPGIEASNRFCNVLLMQTTSDDQL